MPHSEEMAFDWHENRVLFREAVNATATETGFLQRLVEKDYHCSRILRHLAAGSDALVFKGGTCLNKVHAGFYRMSEDLDFSLPVREGATRGEKSRRVRHLKDVLEALAGPSSPYLIIRPLTGANDSTQYTAWVGYPSCLGDMEESVKIEIGMHEPLLLPIHRGVAHTLVRNPSSGLELPGFPLACLSLMEVMAEKLRAALSRETPAIRDYFDVDHAMRRLGFRLGEHGLAGHVSEKLRVVGHPRVDISDEKFRTLQGQLERDLRPVLRSDDFAAFDLQGVYGRVREFAKDVRMS